MAGLITQIKGNEEFRVKVAAGTSITLEGMDTTDKENFPPGGSVGTIKKVVAFKELHSLAA
ncbi:phage tail tube protein [Photorhabdus sp. CRCIA-P01]|uniref:phage tail tube protein n=1 Tax=Photorhabdus sp. CRCIA-P01 TaxID=2019570 RepID=UPI000E59A525|nr:phage tail tube protein [Photorhabdus sp. CRCIA-P01]